MKRILLYGLLLVAIAVQAQEILPYPTDTIDGKVYYRYTVEKSIGLYRISKNFGVTQEAILEANPELRSRGLRYEEVIRIPTNLPATKPEKVKKAEEPEKVEVVENTPKHIEQNKEGKAEKANKLMESFRREVAPLPQLPAQIDSLARPQAEEPQPAAVIALADSLPTTDSLDMATVAMDTIAYTDTVRLTFLLPLQADIVQRSPSIDRFYDFYCGALLALKHHDAVYTDSLGEIHATFYDVRTIDTGKDGKVICQLVDSNMLASTDVIIGPAFGKQVEALSGYVQEHKIPVIIPFLPYVREVNTNPYLMKFNPSSAVHAHALMEHLDTLRSAINIVLVDAYANKMDYAENIRLLRDSINARHLPVTHTTIRQILADSVCLAMKDSVENILLFHSERYSNVQLLMPYLLSGKHGKQLTLLGDYSWQSERITLPQLFTTVFRSPAGEEYARYEQDFAQYFGHQLSATLPRFDLLGYDLTRFVLQTRRDSTLQATDMPYEGTQSSIRFTPIENGGYENTHITIERH